MKSMLAACAVAFAFAGFSIADDKKEVAKVDAAKLVGKWELTKSSDANAPKGAVVVFEKDGKLSITIDLSGKELKLNGKYEVKGDKLTVTLSDGGKEESDTDTIKSLTDDKVVLVDKDGKETELTKKK